MANTNSFRYLQMWQKMMSFVTEMYQLTVSFQGNNAALAEELRRNAALASKSFAVPCGSVSLPEHLLALKATEDSILRIRNCLDTSVGMELVTRSEYDRFDRHLAEIKQMLGEIEGQTPGVYLRNAVS